MWMERPCTFIVEQSLTIGLIDRRPRGVTVTDARVGANLLSLQRTCSLDGCGSAAVRASCMGGVREHLTVYTAWSLVVMRGESE